MKQRATDMMQRQFFVERTRPQRIDIVGRPVRPGVVGLGDQRGAGLRVSRHQPVFAQGAQHRLAPPLVAVAPPRHAARDAPALGQRIAGLRLAPVGEDADAGIDDGDGIAGFVEAKDTPANAVGAEVKGMEVNIPVPRQRRMISYHSSALMYAAESVTIEGGVTSEFSNQCNPA